MTKTEQLIKEVEEDMQGHGVSNEQAEKLIKIVRCLIDATDEYWWIKGGRDKLDRIAEGKE